MIEDRREGAEAPPGDGAGVGPAAFAGPSPASTVAPQGAAARPGRLPFWAEIALLALVVVCALARSQLGTRLDGMTPDEPYHVVAGVSYVRDGDFRLNPEHPPLAKLPVGMALASVLEVPTPPPLADKMAERDFTEEIVFLDNDFRAVQQRARLAMFAFHAVLLGLLLLLLRHVFGFAAALVAGLWLALEPTIGAHLPVVMTDLPVTLTLGLAALACGVAFHTWRWGWCAAAGVGCGLALAAKHSALPGLAGLGILGLLVALVPLLRRRPREAARRGLRLVTLAAVALAVLWLSYGSSFHAASDGTDPFNRPLPAKIDDLIDPSWQRLLHGADALRLVPRAYVWGLADTVRAGVEGRGQDEHYLFGRTWEGHPPWFFWLGIVAAKVPLPHLALALVGALALAVGPPPTGRRRWALVALAVMAVAHFFALMSSQGTYGGVRHALPLVLVLGVVAGAAVTLGPGTRRRASVALTALLLTLSAVLTFGEPRLWEYHNELAGGTSGAADRFSNEGVLLGQRLPEIAAFWHRTLGDPEEPLYAFTWVVEEEAAALGLPLTRRVESIEDDNLAGVYEGVFLIEAGSFRPWPNWDPALLDGLEELTRIGNIHVMRGRVEAPRFRAWDLLERIDRHLNEADDPDWPTVARRLEEVSEALHWAMVPRLLLGNARLAMGDRPAALAAYRAALANTTPGEAVVPLLERQIERLGSATPLGEIGLLRNPVIE